MNILRAFTDHPASVGETYGEHMGVALSFAGPLFLASIACFIHAFLPFAFETTGSRAVKQLYQRMVSHRVRNPQPEPQGEQALHWVI